MFARYATPLVIAVGLTLSAHAEQGFLGQPKMLIYGNYCGPGNNAPLPPIDALDAACARHDACTPNGALPSKACNIRLQREADAISRDPRQTPNVRAMAGFVAAGAAMLQMTDPPETGPTVVRMHSR